MDNNTKATVVSVHSPLIQFSTSGSYYTSYAISLKSSNPCFTHTFSQIRRRYSEFLHLRRRLVSYHPTVKAPVLPPKNFFHRFDDDRIEERRKGLQKFLEEVLATSVYLSDKSLHMFLQSTCSMTQIDEQCVGDIPAPQLLDEGPSIISCSSETSSSVSSDKSDKSNISENLKITILKPEVDSKPEAPVNNFSEKVHSSPASLKQQTFPTLHKCPSSKPRVIPRPQGSLDSSPCSSLSSLDSNYCSSLEYNRSRRVSFNEQVTVAVVYNQLWNIVTVPIRTDA